MKTIINVIEGVRKVMTMSLLVTIIAAAIIIPAMNYFIFKKDLKTTFVATISAIVGIVIVFYFTGRIHF